MKVFASALLAVLALLATMTTVAVAPAGHAAVVAPARGTTIQATTTVYIRSGPSTAYPVIGTAAAGDTAMVLGGPEGEFIDVYHRNHRGWTHRAYWNAVPGLWVNGRQLSANQEVAVRWIAANTLARVPGELSDKLTIVSRVTWWSWKEHVLDLGSPTVHRYSNCNDDPALRDPLYTCPVNNWQVGIAAVHMSNTPGREAEIEALATRLYQGWTVSRVLDHTASYAGYPAGSTERARIVNSTGRLRTSWLLRNHGVGFTFNEPYTRQCLTGQWDQSWCYGDRAPDPATIVRSVQELRAIFYAIRPL